LDVSDFDVEGESLAGRVVRPRTEAGILTCSFVSLRKDTPLVYEPSALVRHVHRRDPEGLRLQMFSWGTGFSSYVISNSLAYPHEAVGFLRLGLHWFWRRSIRRLLISLLRPSRSPGSLVLAEMWGSLIGVFRYFRARLVAKKVEQKFGPLRHNEVYPRNTLKDEMPERKSGFAMRTIDVCQCPTALTDVANYPLTRVFVTRGNCALGYVDIANEHGIVSATRLVESIVQEFNLKVLLETDSSSADFATEETLAILKRHYGRTHGTSQLEKSGRLSVEPIVEIGASRFSGTS